ncbi:hypothetical protein Bca4012_020369 [Brassica carinata]
MYGQHIISSISHLPLFFRGWITEQIHREPARHLPIRFVGLGGLQDSSPASANIFKLLQLITYYMWRERNCRIFRQTYSSPEVVFRIIDRLKKDRLLSNLAMSSMLEL